MPELRFLEWGIQSRYYDPATSLLIDDGSLVTTGFAGSSGSLSGAYGGTAITATLTTTPVAVCGLGDLSHVGHYRVKARVKPSSGTSYARLAWSDGGGSLRANPWQSPQQVGTFIELDLGTVTISQAALGAQRWTGQIEAADWGVSGATFAIDYIELIPAGEGYGKARAPVVFETPTAFGARDEFDQSAGALNGKTLPQGGTWSAAGTGADFQIDATAHIATRAAGSGEAFPVPTLPGVMPDLGLVQVDVRQDGTQVGNWYAGVIARYVDLNNWLAAYVYGGGARGATFVQIKVLIAGSAVRVYSAPFSALPGTWSTIRLTLDASGRLCLWAAPRGGLGGEPLLMCSEVEVAAGGALAIGPSGLYGNNALLSAGSSFDNFFAAVPTVRPVIYAERQVEIRHDGTLMEDATGSYDGPVPEYRGSRFFIPPAGSANRTARVVVKARRNDIEQFEDVPVTDPLQVQVVYTPRYLQVPR